MRGANDQQEKPKPENTVSTFVHLLFNHWLHLDLMPQTRRHRFWFISNLVNTNKATVIHSRDLGMNGLVWPTAEIAAHAKMTFYIWTNRQEIDKNTDQ